MFRVLVLFLISSTSLLAQKNIKVYYDSEKNRVQEDYYVSTENDQLLDGPYKRYFPNGKTEMEGAYKNGSRSGTFLEYFPEGSLQRKISYLDGRRHRIVWIVGGR